ncbi:beta-N-acetylhexosaminidase [Pseudooceanicola sp. CBS1P-1]|uniref:beta-N-acetylhexosaminidase n=1 Tax=Pseudooceanicola albus TaxID=2692189 RepID=A0A6L7G159_9RHOB|nr:MULTISPECIES: beta-N-acetylhexosaminidase [Pseudooceanicola]MBT9383374.1 beta-N-acetylhexosaminidase [Pseudooceanicola endophyticus]MXN16303.1 beta-N-acetylhexosaminidase [Pseudooceanicola albus]
MPFGATILDPTGPVLTSEERALFRTADPFGFILFARHIETADQVRRLCGDLREAVGRDVPILLDQEGGRVQRLRPPLGRQWDEPLDFAARAGDHAEEAMRLRYALIATEMRALGIDVDCAPLIDVAEADTHPFLKSRCYGTDPATVARLGRAVAEGLMQGGVLPVVKHMPGHGRARADSHKELPRVTAALEELDRIDFAPFKVLNHLAMGMTAHIVFEALDPELPATLSPVVMQAIRNRIGFDNLIMTDDISMKALSGGLERITTDALAAGCDVILLCNASFEDRATVVEAAGLMSPAAQERAERVMDLRRAAPVLDIPAMEGRLNAILNG